MRLMLYFWQDIPQSIVVRNNVHSPGCTLAWFDVIEATPKGSANVDRHGFPRVFWSCAYIYIPGTDIFVQYPAKTEEIWYFLTRTPTTKRPKPRTRTHSRESAGKFHHGRRSRGAAPHRVKRPAWTSYSMRYGGAQRGKRETSSSPELILGLFPSTPAHALINSRLRTPFFLSSSSQRREIGCLPTPPHEPLLPCRNLPVSILPLARSSSTVGPSSPGHSCLIRQVDGGITMSVKSTTASTYWTTGDSELDPLVEQRFSTLRI
ncbi:uncharacterized protein N7459_003360 [Penicillium hispanicum]|uniref:uncharacterized protein n=1 Tax=Penicillium hispanicum TaxID=1080232 RepID=UPI002541B873|nr:uncharacterized protein N7459_003360 [Penicillium hispanicum]KAJ5587595.1 hypothetical protein N7459_003360 [Penicillium hispanicum]